MKYKALSCFKAYDIRGKLGSELNESIAWRIGRAYAEYIQPGKVVIGSDIRLTSPDLKVAVATGLLDAGVDVVDIGLAGTEEVYFATRFFNADGGIEITASHNPVDFNGMKLVRRNAQPISGDTGLREIQRLAEENAFRPAIQPGFFTEQSTLTEYVGHLLEYIDLRKIKPLKLVANAGNGAAGHVIDAIEQRFNARKVPISFIKINHAPDGRFPNGIPNPLLPENRSDTANAVIANGADMGIAWDGDFDRCFLFDEKGRFIEGYYIIGLLAQTFLSKHPGEKIIHDPRLTWNTIDIVKQHGGIPVQSKAGHAFIKERMRAENALYGGEMSAHHYFRDFAYCDSGMIPWLLIIELLSTSNQALSQLVHERQNAFPCSGEINYPVSSAVDTIRRIEQHFQADNPVVDRTDGLSLEFSDWRMNLRASNTEPLLRLNIESRGNAELVAERVKEIEQIIHSMS